LIAAICLAMSAFIWQLPEQLLREAMAKVANEKVTLESRFSVHAFGGIHLRYAGEVDERRHLHHVRLNSGHQRAYERQRADG
jgi:hypothetical protein